MADRGSSQQISTPRNVYAFGLTSLLNDTASEMAYWVLPAFIASIAGGPAQLGIIEGIADRLKIPLDRFFVNLDKYGNTSAAAVAMALDEANRTGRIKHGDYVLMVVFGGGLTWASTIIEW